jgi:Ca2+-transporting ATPase
MPTKVLHTTALTGLNESDIPGIQLRFGKNTSSQKNNARFFHFVMSVLKEPMVIILSVASLLYFLLQNVDEGLMMIAAMAFVVGISIYQDVRSSNALEALKQLAEEKVKVIRDGKEKYISSVDLVPGDIMLLEGK